MHNQRLLSESECPNEYNVRNHGFFFTSWKEELPEMLCGKVNKTILNLS
jgi:hypothetical protein